MFLRSIVEISINVCGFFPINHKDTGRQRKYKFFVSLCLCVFVVKKEYRTTKSDMELELLWYA
jgi:hypothetical protein